MQPRVLCGGTMDALIDKERHMKQQRKHILEFFKRDPWPVKVGVLAMWFLFLLTATSGAAEKLAKVTDWIGRLH